MKKLFITLGIIGLALAMDCVSAQNVDNSLKRHDFFYAGQSKQRRMFIVEDGQVKWSYDDRLQRGEISDAILLSDGHIMVAHQYGIAEMDKEGKTLWSYAAPESTEIHTLQPIGQTHVVFVQNGKPAKAIVMEIPACRIVREFELPTNEKSSVHGQFRNARLTSRGTLLVANMSLGCIHEFNSAGQEVDRWDGFLPWSVQELPKGNLLITGRKGHIQEINRQGQTVWEMNTTDFGVTQPQKTVRLKDGGHIVNNWYNEWNKEPMDTLNAPVQAIEIDKDGRITNYKLRQSDPKRHTVEAFQSMNFKVIAFGDSYNDVSMLKKAEVGILFCPPQKVIDEFPELPVAHNYAELKALIEQHIYED